MFDVLGIQIIYSYDRWMLLITGKGWTQKTYLSDSKNNPIFGQKRKDRAAAVEDAERRLDAFYPNWKYFVGEK